MNGPEQVRKLVMRVCDKNGLAVYAPSHWHDRHPGALLDKD